MSVSLEIALFARSILLGCEGQVEFVSSTAFLCRSRLLFPEINIQSDIDSLCEQK